VLGLLPPSDNSIAVNNNNNNNSEAVEITLMDLPYTLPCSFFLPFSTYFTLFPTVVLGKMSTGILPDIHSYGDGLVC